MERANPAAMIVPPSIQPDNPTPEKDTAPENEDDWQHRGWRGSHPGSKKRRPTRAERKAKRKREAAGRKSARRK